MPAILPAGSRAVNSGVVFPGAAAGDDERVDTALGILLLAVSVAGVIVVLAAFVWAARKDGEQDRALQRRLGIRRRTRLGR
ncbi:MAG TPA: hypothetical protein VIE18_05135 [Gaiellaceae bacterium]|jgi:heme/copper-type cytochrome/quinol oxidase subunit 2